ncbi:MAG: RNA polymerase sigma factor [Daejeonella sp.]
MRRFSTIEERALLEQVSLGDREAYAKLYAFYIPKLYRFIYPFANQSKEDTEEVLQDIFLKIWVRKETLTDLRSFESYLFRMAKNQLTDHRKRNLSRQNLVIKLMPGSETENATAHDNLVYTEYLLTAKEAVYKLTSQRRKIFEMRMQQDMAIDEIATKLNITRSAVKKQLYEAIFFVKTYLNYHTGWPLLVLWLSILAD